MSDQIDPGLFEQLRRWLLSRPEEAQPAGRAVADEMHQALPDALSARSAVETDRDRKKRLIDDALVGN